MRFEKFVNIVPVKADVLIGFIDNKIILPLYIFKNKEVMIHNRLDISNELKSIKTLYKAGMILSSRAYFKEELDSLSSIDNILKSSFNGTFVKWRMQKFDVNIMSYIEPEPAVLVVTREYLKAYDMHREAKVYHTLTRDQDEQIVYGLANAREEYPIITDKKVEYRQRLLDACGGDKDYRDYAMFYVRNIEGKKNGK